MLLQSNTLHITINHAGLIFFIIYLFVLIAIGLYTARFSSQGIREYFIGGRQLNKYVVAISAVVSGRSAWLLFYFTALSYTIGLAAIWAVLGYIVMEFWMFRYYAPRLRNFAERHDTLTIPEFYAIRFQDHNQVQTILLRLLTASIILVFMIAYVATLFVAGGKVFAASFGITTTEGTFLSALIILLYTVFGGFMAVSLTDVIKALFLLIALTVLPIYAIWLAGGLNVVVYEAQLYKADFFDLNSIAFGSLCSFLALGLGSLGSPHILVRYLSIKDAKAFKQVAIIGTFWNIILALGALLIGIVAHVYLPEFTSITAGDPENIYPDLAQGLLHPALFGIVVTSIFAAIMSTADSELLVAASSVVRDFYEKTFQKNTLIPSKKLVRYSRMSVILIVVLALAVGFIAPKFVFSLEVLALGGLAASIGATTLLALFWRGTSKIGVIAGIISGISALIVWKHVEILAGILDEILASFVISILITMILSLIYPPKPNVIATLNLEK